MVLISKRTVSSFVYYTKCKFNDIIEVRGAFLPVTQFMSNNHFSIFHLNLICLTSVGSSHHPDWYFTYPDDRLPVLGYISTARMANQPSRVQTRQNVSLYFLYDMHLQSAARQSGGYLPRMGTILTRISLSQNDT